MIFKGFVYEIDSRDQIGSYIVLYYEAYSDTTPRLAYFETWVKAMDFQQTLDRGEY